MTAPWQTMPDFVDGTVVDEGDLDPVVANVNGLRDAPRFLRGKWVQKAGNLVNGIVTEFTVLELTLDNVTVTSGQYYRFIYNVYGQARVAAGNSYLVRVRKNTAGSGAVVVQTMWRLEASGVDDSKCFVLPWKATSTETATYYLSFSRQAGGGVLDIRGDGLSGCSIERAGDNVGSIWTTVT